MLRFCEKQNCILENPIILPYCLNTLLTEIPVRDLRYIHFLKNSSILLSRLQTLVSSYLEASEHLLIIEDKVSHNYDQSECMLSGTADAKWIHETDPLLKLIQKFSSRKPKVEEN